MQRLGAPGVVLPATQEEPMRKSLYCSVIALTLCGAGFAAAQQQGPPDTPTPPGRATSPEHTIPPTGAAQPQAPQADQAKPAAVGPAQASATGAGSTEEVPGATRQTMPSTISVENARQDKLPITAFQFTLNDEQRRKIVESIGRLPGVTVDNFPITVSGKLPFNVEMQDMPADIVHAMPEAAKYKYVKLSDRVLIVDPPNWTVVKEISK
jgi:hypothetical protein